MQNEFELQQVVFNIIKTQIEFGVYRCGDSLPTIKESTGFFMASVDTIRLAYVRLKQEGYISLNTGIGAAVKVCYNEDEIRSHIQAYFPCRKEAIMDLAKASQPLFGYAQCLAFRSATKEVLDKLEESNRRKDVPVPYRMSRQFILLYGSLGNELLMRLIWQMFLFLQGPYLSLPHSMDYFAREDSSYNDILMDLIRLCRKKDWETLRNVIYRYNDERYHALCQFYDSEILCESDTKQVEFCWYPYKKTTQLCYSICKDLMMKIKIGDYSAGSFLPSLNRLAQEKQVSVNTIRRTLQLLNKLGAVQSVNGVGTKVLPLFDCAVNCNFNDDDIQKQLLHFAQGYHILALSCQACSKITMASMNAESIRQWVRKLEALKCTGVYEDVIFTCYEAISLHAPYQVIRSIYSELTQQLFWGAPLRNLYGDRENIKAHFLPYLDALIDGLARRDAEGFSRKLEEMQVYETNMVAEYITEVGVREAASLFIDNTKS